MTQQSEMLELPARELATDEPITDSVAVQIEVVDEPTTQQMLKAVELSGSLDFWLDDEEDVYSA